MEKSSQGKKNKNGDKPSIFKVLSNTSLEAFPNNYYIYKIETFQSQSSIILTCHEWKTKIVSFLPQESVKINLKKNASISLPTVVTVIPGRGLWQDGARSLVASVNQTHQVTKCPFSPYPNQSLRIFYGQYYHIFRYASWITLFEHFCQKNAFTCLTFTLVECVSPIRAFWPGNFFYFFYGRLYTSKGNFNSKGDDVYL